MKLWSVGHAWTVNSLLASVVSELEVRISCSIAHTRKIILPLEKITERGYQEDLGVKIKLA